MSDDIEIRNAERARRAAAALQHYHRQDHTPGHWQDFLADFMHFVHRQGADFQDLLRTATMHFQAEIKGDE